MCVSGRRLAETACKSVRAGGKGFGIVEMGQQEEASS